MRMYLEAFSDASFKDTFINEMAKRITLVDTVQDPKLRKAFAEYFVSYLNSNPDSNRKVTIALDQLDLELTLLNAYTNLFLRNELASSDQLNALLNGAETVSLPSADSIKRLMWQCSNLGSCVDDKLAQNLIKIKPLWWRDRSTDEIFGDQGGYLAHDLNQLVAKYASKFTEIVEHGIEWDVYPTATPPSLTRSIINLNAAMSKVGSN